MTLKTYDVLIQHYGDRQYYAGEKREMAAAAAAELVARGVLRAMNTKAAPKPKNKMAPALADKT